MGVYRFNVDAYHANSRKHVATIPIYVKGREHIVKNLEGMYDGVASQRLYSMVMEKINSLAERIETTFHLTDESMNFRWGGLMYIISGNNLGNDHRYDILVTPSMTGYKWYIYLLQVCLLCLPDNDHCI